MWRYLNLIQKKERERDKFPKGIKNIKRNIQEQKWVKAKSMNFKMINGLCFDDFAFDIIEKIQKKTFQ